MVAAGAWTDTLTGLPEAARVPIRPLKGQTLRLRDPSGPGLLRRVVRYPGGYLVPRDDGRYILGATMEERGYDLTATAGGVYELLRDARELVPGVSELVIEELAVGLRPGTPDNVAAIGRGTLDGLVWAVGHHRNGILLAPLTADLVSAAVLGDELPGDIAEACDPDPSRARAGDMIRVNGEPVSIAPGETLTAVIAALGVQPDARGVAIAVDGEVVPRAAWDAHVVTDGARVEVLTAMQGG